MNSGGSIVRIAAVLAAASTAMALAGVAQAATTRPAGMSKAEYRALMLRSEALNQEYGIGTANRALMLRSEALNQKYGLGRRGADAEGMTAAEYRALMLRSEALNKTYGLGKQASAAAPSQPTRSARGFAWEAFGIGAAVMFGLALLAGGYVVRRRLLATLRGLAPRYRTT